MTDSVITLFVSISEATLNRFIFMSDLLFFCNFRWEEKIAKMLRKCLSRYINLYIVLALLVQFGSRRK